MAWASIKNVKDIVKEGAVEPLRKMISDLNNFSNIQVGERIYAAEGNTDTLPLIAGANMAITATENGIEFSSSGTGGVTGVKGNAESSYREGNVNITPANIGLGNVGNFKAVSTAAGQGLSDTEKSNARANIGAQPTLTLDSAVTKDSSNFVTSGTIYTAIYNAVGLALSTYY